MILVILLQRIQKRSFKTEQPAMVGHPLHIASGLEAVPDVQLRIAVENKLHCGGNVHKMFVPVQRFLSQQFCVKIQIQLPVTGIFFWKQEVAGR